MEISRFNSEGYHDPTTYEALSKIRKEELAEKRAYRPLVYICSPLAGDMDGNMEKARRYCKFAVRSGAIPLAPHLLFPQFMDDTNPDERGACHVHEHGAFGQVRTVVGVREEHIRGNGGGD